MKYGEMVPPVYEMEKILARRKDPAEREKVLTFYDVLMQNIADELDGKQQNENETVEGLLVQLVHDLTEKGQYEQYEELTEQDRRFELLLMLFDRVKSRRDKVAKREEILDEVAEKNVPQSFFDASTLQPEDIYELPSAMWEQAIDKIPTKTQMERLKAAYPLVVIDRFLKTLSDHKEIIALRMQRRHENIVSQMKKELRKEGEKKIRLAQEAETSCSNAVATLNAVRAQYKKKMDAERMNSAKYEMPVSEHTKQYEQMKAAVFDTQRLVEEEALRGKFLAAQINAVSEQTEKFMHVNDDIVTKTEETNMKIMKNIKKLSTAVRQYESRLSDLRAMAQGRNKKKDQQMSFFL